MTKTPSPNNSIANVGLPTSGTSWWDDMAMAGTDSVVKIITRELTNRVTRPMNTVQVMVEGELFEFLEANLAPVAWHKAYDMLRVIVDLFSFQQVFATEVVGECLARFGRGTGSLEGILQECFIASGYDLDEIKLLNRDALRAHDDGERVRSILPDLDLADPEAVWTYEYKDKRKK